MTNPNAVEWKADIRKEIRFAVVLYGGVSLAIYISGVVRELLAMVRATAPGIRNSDDADARSLMNEPSVDGSAAVYRELASALNAPREREGDNIVYTRFVVDVISGTSAGGLNGIYLGKALAEGQSLDGLRKFWLDFGDIVGLLDKKNAQPRSILSGGNMLSWLHQAFTDMPPVQIPPVVTRSLVEDVQCFATTTDLRGIPIFLRLSDMSVAEQRHKTVYRFAFSDGAWTSPRNDFHNNDLALSLAARCTSSFPAAFAPTAIGDLEQRELGTLTDDEIQRTFPDYKLPGATSNGSADERLNPMRHAFADGGILNNKPFSHAISALGTRRGGKPSERKLIYVEPSPEQVPGAMSATDGDPSTPDFFSVIEKAFTLPSQQTIREDLQRIGDRNRLIDRMGGVLADIPHEVKSYSDVVVNNLGALRLVAEKAGASGVAALERIARLEKMAAPIGANAAKDASDAFIASDIDDMVAIYGLGYAGYHRVKVAAVTDDLGSLVAQLLSMPDESDDWLAVRLLVRAWRDLSFAPYRSDNRTVSETARYERLKSLVPQEATAARARLDQRVSENDFLVRFDLRFGLRRLDFVLNKIDDLFCMDGRATTLLHSFGVADANAWMTKERREELGRLAQGLGAVYMMLQSRLESLGDPQADDFELGMWEQRLTEIARVDTSRLAPFVADDVAPGSEKLSAMIANLGIDQKARRDLLALPEQERERQAFRTIASSFDNFERAANELSRQVLQASRFARRWSTAILPDSLPIATTLIEPGNMIRFLYDHFEAVDRITFPVFYQTDVGHEVDTVGLVRISPDDATSITGQKKGEPVHKLGGETLGHFGGFFARQWRASDFLWGQLDAAERLILEVTAGSDMDAARIADFVRRAQGAILEDEMNVEDIPQLMAITPSERLAHLKEKKNWQAMIEPPHGLHATVGTAVAGGLPILATIFRQGGSGPFGALAARVGGPALLLVESTFKPGERFVVFLVCGLLALSGIASMYSGGASLVSWLPMYGSHELHVFSIAGRVLGGALLAAVAGGVLYLWFRIKRALESLRTPSAAP
ncbi:MAG: patatin-like protein [bacterium]